MPTGLRPAARMIMAMGVALAGCSGEPSVTPSPPTSAAGSQGGTPSTSAVLVLPQAPDQAMYRPSAERVAAAKPGELIASAGILSASGTRAWFVVYGSTGLDGQPVAVSGVIVAPDAEPAAGNGYPIVAWAHGTTGIADACSPSNEGIGGLGPLVELAASGYVVTATDYEGLGTDGIHPYLVGISEGRSVLDSIRAAKALPDARAGKDAVVIGISQGGHATLWAAELQPTYAPELAVLGAFAASPPTDMVSWETWAFEEAAAGKIDAAAPPVMIFGVWHVVYGAPLDFLTDAAQQSALAVPDGCDPTMQSTTPYVRDPAQIATWRDLLAANSPGAARTDVPIRVVSPKDDQAVDYATQLAGVARMCAIGDTVELITVPGGHDASIDPPAAWAAAVTWIDDRFAGVPPVSTCA
jgi:pimeloyl-ACP methyl ester carboxylesterase